MGMFKDIERGGRLQGSRTFVLRAMQIQGLHSGVTWSALGLGGRWELLGVLVLLPD